MNVPQKLNDVPATKIRRSSSAILCHKDNITAGKPFLKTLLCFARPRLAVQHVRFDDDNGEQYALLLNNSSVYRHSSAPVAYCTAVRYSTQASNVRKPSWQVALLWAVFFTKAGVTGLANVRHVAATTCRGVCPNGRRSCVRTFPRLFQRAYRSASRGIVHLDCVIADHATHSLDWA